MAKKINVRPYDWLVSSVHKTGYGIVFNNGTDWKSKRRTFLQLLKNTGFQPSVMEMNIKVIWPKIKQCLNQKEMVIGLYDPMVADKSTPLYQLELVLIELIIETCIDKSVFSGREIPSSYLEVFNAFRANGIQRIETSSWYR